MRLLGPAFVVLLLWVVPADAHKASDAYLRLEVGAAPARGSLDIALADLELAIGLDQDGDGAITWRELSSRHLAVESYVRTRLAFSAGDDVCTIRPEQHLVDRHTDGAYAVLRFALACPVSSAPLRLRYDLLFDADPTHRGLLTLDQGGRVTAQILSPSEPVADLAIDDDAASGFTSFFMLGVHHILGGLDHLLFLLVALMPVVLQPSTPRVDRALEVLRILTSFTLAHALALAFAVVGAIDLPASLVEAAILATIVATATDNIRPWLPGRRWAVTFGFGLVHGLGFAAALDPMNLPGWELAVALIGFNIGIEAVQLALALLFPIVVWPLFALAPGGRPLVLGGSTAAILLVGLWLADRMLG